MLNIAPGRPYRSRHLNPYSGLEYVGLKSLREKKNLATQHVFLCGEVILAEKAVLDDSIVASQREALERFKNFHDAGWLCPPVHSNPIFAGLIESQICK
jgi:hypothetical protein